MAEFDPMSLVGLFHIMIKLPKGKKDALFFNEILLLSILDLFWEES